MRDEIKALVWTLAGTGMVLITLSGETLKWGIVISASALIIYLAATFPVRGEEDDGA